jgi:dissimilatory sulfite reductase (desulfoviridin) alpha/beta subunit
VYLSALDALKIKRSGWDLFVGGKWGRRPQLGVKLYEFLREDEVPPLVEKIRVPILSWLISMRGWRTDQQDWV